jgi:hypothetical protein
MNSTIKNMEEENQHIYKKYIVFCIDQYYPSGGLSDIGNSFDTIDKAREYIKKNRADYNEIIDKSPSGGRVKLMHWLGGKNGAIAI